MKIEQHLKTFVIHNPVAGVSDKKVIRREICRLMEENAIPYKYYETTKGEDVHQLVKATLQDGYQRFIAMGGDGTISAVASGLVRTDIPLVIIPTGTANALAQELKIPLNLEASLNWWLADCEIKTLDAMQVGERFYILKVSTGFSSELMKKVKRQDKRKYGVLAYLKEAAKNLTTLSAHNFQIVVDGQRFQDRAYEVLVSNNKNLGLQPLQLNTNIEVDDRKLSLCLVRGKNIGHYLRLFLGMVVRQIQPGEELLCKDVHREVRIESKRRLPVQGDGDDIGYTPLVVTLVPAAVRVLVPVTQA